MKQNIINVILSGGSGTRLWPLSRQSKPKQFLQMFGGQSLFQHTLLRNKDYVDEFMIITNKNQYVQAQEQSDNIKITLKHKIIEPVGRNTAPAIALAALSVDKDSILFVTPSDHMISDLDQYKKCLQRAVELANKNKLVTFGIQPTSPDTGFGYIEFDGEDVLQFREKPDYKTAVTFLEKGNFYWNSGMFCFKAGIFLEELEKLSPEIYLTSKAAYKTIHDGEINKEAMKSIPSDSIDYAVMEKSNKVKTVASNFKWTDLGSFDAIISYQKNGGVVDNLRNVNGKNNSNTYAFSKKEVFANNLSNQIIIDTGDSLVFLPFGKSGEIKEIYNKVSKEDSSLVK